MPLLESQTTYYENQKGEVSWRGIGFHDNDHYDSFLTNDVFDRLRDTERESEFQSCLRGLATTGFANENIDKILSAEIPEERDWAAGEALAEAWLSKEYQATWPWNMERDKRTPKASLPGADLIGFCKLENEGCLLLGEVKASRQKQYPPNVLNGRSGMIHQIDQLAHNLGIINQVLKWLWHRCRNTEFEETFQASVKLYIDSGNKAVSLFGVLIRDTEANELDLKNRAGALSRSITAPTKCCLIAIHLPHPIEELPKKIEGGLS